MSTANFQFGDFTLDVVKGCLFKAGVEIKLRPKVFETLRYFVEHPGQLISKQELIKAVWPDAFVTDDSLVQCTLELRRALQDAGQALLKTVPRRGYLFTAEVVRLPARPEHVPAIDDFGLSNGRLPALGKAARKTHDLPVPRTSFVGREQQVAEAGGLLLRDDIRLVTLTGPGGAGKTRLALAVAAAIAGHFPAGVRFVRLASITNPELVALAIADALEIQQVASRTIPQLIADRLRDLGPFLVVLDNFEQLLPAATVVAEILEACPSLKILVTTRSCLRIYGEQEFPVAPLSQSAAVDLFAQRAAAVWPDFAITSENAAVLQEICARLDHLPLAIELAAARTRLLSPPAILDRLESRLQLLTSGALDLPERQQTLRNAIDWSHDLLNEPEMKLFRRLSVFAGGCTLEAAEAVCNTSLDLGIDLLDGLASLVDKNLVLRLDRAETEPRFAMLETIREYAAERLAASGELAAVRRSHAAFCLVLAEEGNPSQGDGQRALWLAQCDLEIDNFRVALDWLFQTLDLDWGFRLCVALFRFWDMREHLTEGRARLETILHLAGSERARDRARVYHFLGALTSSQGDFSAALHFLECSLVIYQQLGDEAGVAASFNALAVSERDRGDYASAQANFEQSLVLWRKLSDRLAIARCLHNLANVLKVRGDYPRARVALSEATDIFHQLGDRHGAAWSLNQEGDIARAQDDVVAARALYQCALLSFQEAGDQWGTARSLTDLGAIDCEQGDHLSAHTCYRQALEIFAGLGHRRGAARALEGTACLALARGEAARALKLAGSAARLRQLISAPLPPAEQLKLDQMLRPAWLKLGEEDGKNVWAEGAAMSLESAIQYSREEPASTN